MKKDDITYVIRLPHAQRLLVARLLLDYTKRLQEENRKFIDSGVYQNPIAEEVEVAYQALNKIVWGLDDRDS